MWTHTMLDNNNELLLKALRLFVDDKIDPEALKIMLRDIFEIDAIRINTKPLDARPFDGSGPW